MSGADPGRASRRARPRARGARSWTLAALVLAASAIPGALLRAQPFEIVNEGAPAANVDVFAVLDDGKPVEVGTTNADGSVDLSFLDFGKGETVEVWVKRCVDGTVQVFLVRPSAIRPGERVCSRDAAEGEECPSCEKIGTFVWGEGRVVIDPALVGTVTQVPAEAGAANLPPQILGFGGGLGWYPSLEDVACDQDAITACDAPTAAAVAQILYQFRLASSISLGLVGTYAPLGTIDQRFGPRADGATSSTVDLDVFSAGGYLGWHPAPHRGNRLGFMFGLGFLYAWNEATIETLHPDGPATEDRSEGGLRGLGTVGFDWYLNRRSGLRLEAAYSSGGSDDADTNLLLAGKYLWLPKPWRGWDLR